MGSSFAHGVLSLRIGCRGNSPLCWASASPDRLVTAANTARTCPGFRLIDFVSIPCLVRSRWVGSPPDLLGGGRPSISQTSWEVRSGWGFGRLQSIWRAQEDSVFHVSSGRAGYDPGAVLAFHVIPTRRIV